MAPKKLPLQSSNNVSIPDHTATTTGITIEEMDQIKTPLLEHILLNPDNYIGSVQKCVESLWVYNPDSQMEHRSVRYVPGLFMIFDVILDNAANNKQRDPNMDRVEVEINPDANSISVLYTGVDIPVEMHREEDVSVPELILGNLWHSSNYDDMKKKTTGVKLTNIFSTVFVIETADGKRQYKQVFTNNMSKKENPVTSKCKASDNWTKVSFKPDLAKFNMTRLEDDMVALMKKRVVDLAGCLSACPGKKVQVLLNGKEIEVKSFHDYAQFYLNSANENREVPLPRIDNNSKEDINPRWQISVSRSEGQFQQVSFVNNINTINGGNHVDYITAQITKFIIDIVKKKNKNANLKPQIVENHLWIFVNAVIDNPAFAMGKLMTPADSFGTTCDLSDKFLKKVVDSSGVVERLLSWAEVMQKTGGAKTQRLCDIPELEDATEAGGSRSHDCTLILTKGDSAEALAMAWLSVVGRKIFGVFHLRGKLPNKRDASFKQISENAEINNINKILGLLGESYGKKSSVKQLRYGHLMIMADQDHDGSNIKGLLINIIYTFWPSGIRNSSFMLEFDTPRMKVVRGKGKDKKVMSFYSMPEYEEWVKNTGADVEKWTVKYNKGLGTSDSNEAREYFSNLKNNRKVFVWSDDKDGDEIELAFSKEIIDARKDLLREEENGSYLDHAEEMIKYTGHFVHNELKLFSRVDLRRSIPSMVDGLKHTQRKVLFCAFKKNFVHKINVAQFSAYVSEKSSYHHVEASIPTTIVGMAQNFVGSNNVNLLMPNGQFGTRRLGGKDAGSSRDIYTKLADVTRSMFPKEDDVLLDYLKEDGLQIEPVWYMPIIPMVLVNGSEEIGTGWSTFIPNYNPRDIIANIRRLINNESLKPMDPWYKNFKGTIQRAVPRKESGVTYTVTGTIDLVRGDVEGDDEGEAPDDETDVKLLITELPIRKWTQDYKEFLMTMVKDGFIKSFDNGCTNEAVEFSMVLSKRNYNLAIQEGLVKKFKLTTSLTTSNMHLLDKDNKIVKYDSPEQILKEFYHLRLKYYIKRKERYLEIYEAELGMLDNQVRFILEVLARLIIVRNRNKAELVRQLRDRGFKPFPSRVKPVEPVVGATEDEVAEGSEELGESAETATEESLGGYDYLFSMAISSFKIKKAMELRAYKDKVLNQIEDLKKQSVKSLWFKDLDELKKALDEKDKREAEEAKEYASISNDPTKKPTRNLKVTKAKPKLETTSSVAAVAMETENPPQPAKGKGKAVPKKAPTKKGKTTVVEREEDEDIPDLPARFTAYHLDSSPENSAVMETDAPPKQAASRGTLDFVQEISDEEVPSPKPVKKGRGGKTQQPAATKKRASDRKGQKPITDEMVDASPDKKVRKTRPSEVTKMRSSSLNSILKESVSTERSDLLLGLGLGLLVLPVSKPPTS